MINIENLKFDRNKYVVKPVSHLTAMLFIEKYHYAKSSSRVSVFTFGLFEKENDFFEHQILGVSIWLPPTKNTAKTISENWTKVLALTRLAIHPDIPTNGCSYLLSKSRKLIKRDGRFKHLVTFADTYKNHTGKIYLADNWQYLGLTKPTPVWINERGQTMGAKRAGKNLTKKEMQELGFSFKGNFSKHKYKYDL